MGAGRSGLLRDRAEARYVRRSARMTCMSDQGRDDHRLTIPIFRCRPTFDVREDPGYSLGKIRISSSLDIVNLHESEVQRIRGRYPNPYLNSFGIRLELEGVKAEEAVIKSDDLLDIFVLAVDHLPLVAGRVLDQYEGDTWIRKAYLSDGHWMNLGEPVTVSAKAVQWLRSFTSLCEELPEVCRRSMIYYRLSMQYSKEGQPSMALVAAALSWETLLGLGADRELTHKLALRGAHLVASGADRKQVYRKLKNLYGERSRVVHSGKDGKYSSGLAIRRFLRIAIPALALLFSKNEQREVFEALDDSAFFVQEAIEEFREESYSPSSLGEFLNGPSDDRDNSPGSHIYSDPGYERYALPGLVPGWVMKRSSLGLDVRSDLLPVQSGFDKSGPFF